MKDIKSEYTKRTVEGFFGDLEKGYSYKLTLTLNKKETDQQTEEEQEYNSAGESDCDSEEYEMDDETPDVFCISFARYVVTSMKLERLNKYKIFGGVTIFGVVLTLIFLLLTANPINKQKENIFLYCSSDYQCKVESHESEFFCNRAGLCESKKKPSEIKTEGGADKIDDGDDGSEEYTIPLEKENGYCYVMTKEKVMTKEGKIDIISKTLPIDEDRSCIYREEIGYELPQPSMESFVCLHKLRLISDVYVEAKKTDCKRPL